MLHLQNIAFEFGGQYLFRDVDWFIKPKERIALIGKNGAGKTTLIKLIVGQYDLREGHINKQGDLQVGYLSQDMISDDGSVSVLETAMQAFEEAVAIHEEIELLLKKIEEDPSEDNIHALADLQERFTAIDGYNIEHKTAEILEGLGFKTEDLNRPLEEFSGGWRMRVILARMLLQEPDLMLMDEPTNHLDLPSIEWLETYLSTYPGSVVIISHDREFLNRMTNKTAEISNQQLYLWDGNYDFYLTAKEERDSLLARKLENQKQYIKEQEKFINRFRYKATKAKAVQSRIKMLEKLDSIEEIQEDSSSINIDFKVSTRSGKVVMKMEEISKAFDANEVFKNVQLEINRGDKIALIGANGTGKSTLLRIIADREEFSGKRIEGHQVIESFYAQHQLESLDLKSDVISELKQTAPNRTESSLRSVLGCFLFSGDDVYKKIKVLSGGEKARVALSKTLVSEANFLMLDEPTNHLDMASIELLIEALENYEGTLIFVSHNRYFINKLANKIFWIEDKDVKVYPGNFEEYTYKQSKAKPKKVAPKKVQGDKKPDKSAWKKKDQTKQAINKLQNRIRNLETELAGLQSEMKNIDSELAKNNSETIAQLGEQYNSLSKKENKIKSDLDDLVEDLILLEDQI